jgi:hypothetical protein
VCKGQESSRIVVGGFLGDEAVVGEDASLWQAVHPLLYFYKDMFIVDKIGKQISLHDCVGDVFCWNYQGCVMEQVMGSWMWWWWL